jgi:hypothetical protein
MEAIPKVSRSVLFDYCSVTFLTERYHFSGKTMAVEVMQKIFHFFLTSRGKGIRMRGLRQGVSYSSIRNTASQRVVTAHIALMASAGMSFGFAQVPVF